MVSSRSASAFAPAGKGSATAAEGSVSKLAPPASGAVPVLAPPAELVSSPLGSTEVLDDVEGTKHSRTCDCSLRSHPCCSLSDTISDDVITGVEEDAAPGRIRFRFGPHSSQSQFSLLRLLLLTSSGHGSNMLNSMGSTVRFPGTGSNPPIQRRVARRKLK